ncbi:MAG: hypothetical protein A2Y24_08335 [Clostridiales bacterium GWE2_32_10]|nr:MAG: hypothetical protein A2Y24_08335 [Clostridiales bacterium GWE2_32_10]HBY19482.1 hypothetical protein [Clostridiales bacterium]
MLARKIIMEEIKNIPQKHMAEIIDFIKFIKSKNEKERKKDITLASEEVMTKYWDTEEEDSAWSNL